MAGAEGLEPSARGFGEVQRQVYADFCNPLPCYPVPPLFLDFTRFLEHIRSFRLYIKELPKISKIQLLLEFY